MGTFGRSNSLISLAAGPYDAKELQKNLTIFTHEIWHYIFGAYLSEEIPIFKEMERLRANNILALKGQFSIYNNYGGLEKCRENPACVEEVSKYRSELPAELKNATKISQSYWNAHIEEVNFYNSITPAFDEFYADVVTAVFFNDPDHLIHNLKGMIDIPSCRSFSKSYVLDEEGKSDIYCLLSEFRAQLWKDWIAPRLKNRQELLKELGVTMAEEAAIAVKAGQVDPQIVVPRLKRRLGIY